MGNLRARIADLSITKKVLAAPLIMLAFMLGTGLYALLALGSLDNRVSYVATDLSPGTSTATNLMSEMFQDRLAADRFLANNSQAALDAWREEQRQTMAAIDTGRNQFVGSDRAPMFERVTELHSEFSRVFADEVAPMWIEINRIRDEELEPLGRSVSSRVGNLMELAYSNQALDVGDLAGLVTRDILLGRIAVGDFLRTGTADAEAEANSIIQSIHGNIELLEIIAFSDMAEEQASLALADWESYLERLAEIVRLRYASTEATESQLYVVANAMTDAARALQGDIAEELDVLAASTNAQTQSALVWQSLLTLLAGVLALSIAWYSTRQVVGPLLATNQEIDQILKDIDAGRGDLTRRVAVHSNDEVGQLTGNFNRFVETLQGIVRDIADGTQQLAAAAEELSAVTSQTSAGVQQQNGETDQVATAITQMTATVQEIARNASDASQAAADASESATSGRSIVNNTVEAINRLVQLLESGGGSVDKLSQDVEAITTIIDVIREVAEQTNLLALNAAIEAARAGEQGRGFAVVADEVRDLAQKTQSSTHKIQELIETLQQGAHSAVGAMNEGRSQGQRTIEHAAEAGSALERIDRKVKAINDMNAQIASAAEEQTAVSDDIAASVSRIRDIAGETAGGAQQTAGSSEELARLGERLNQLVNQFKV